MAYYDTKEILIIINQKIGNGKTLFSDSYI